jgi:hypothetical protein
MDALAASPFAMLDAHGSLRFVTDMVHEDDAPCIVLACRALRSALRTRDVVMARLAAEVDTDGLLDLSRSRLCALPEGVGRLACLPRPEFHKLSLYDNPRLAALPVALGRLGSLEELDIYGWARWRQSAKR